MNINQVANVGQAPASGETNLIDSSASKKTAAPAAAAAPVDAASQDKTTQNVASKAEVKKSVDAISRFLSNNDQLKFSLDQDSGKQLVQLVDIQTKVVLRQFPTVEALAIAKNLDRMQGVFVNSEA